MSPIDRAQELDRVWFANNPKRNFRLRDTIPGEFDMPVLAETEEFYHSGTTADFLMASASADAELASATASAKARGLKQYTIVMQAAPGFRTRGFSFLEPMSRQVRRSLGDNQIRALFDGVGLRAKSNRPK